MSEEARTDIDPGARRVVDTVIEAVLGEGESSEPGEELHEVAAPSTQTPPGGAPLDGPPTAYPRLFQSVDRRRSAPSIVIKGADRAKFDDLYHRFLTITWTRFLILAASAYFGVNFVFALFYWADGSGVANMKSGSLTDAFFFSVQTFGTLGYGVMAPKDLYTNVIVTIESFMGLGAVAISTGLIFARVSRPTARVMFSRIAVITRHEGVPTLIFRAANRRANQILEAEVTISLARQITTLEGMRVRRMEDLKVVRSRSPMFALTWMIMHRIDESSPLFGATPQSMLEDHAEIVVVLAGVDETFAQRIHARHSYIPSELVWNRQLADILSVDEAGRRVVDYTLFHDLAP